ncbi:hypothetical protein P5V15_008169 [Pogonomyrmex californicus]
MICIETQYFSLNRTLLLAFGLWPYQQSKFTRLQFILFFGILTSSILFQVKDLMIELQNIYNNLEDECESAIVRKYNYNAKRYTTMLTVIAVCSMFIFTFIQFWSNIFDIILSRNVSQSHHVPIIMEYFIDQNKYFYLIMLHIHVAICIGIVSMVAIGTMLIAYLQHTCGMFRISSYRIERAMKSNMLQNIILKNENLILQGIISAIDIHRLAMKLSKLLVSKFELMLFCLITVGVISLSLNLFRVFQMDSSIDNIRELIFPVLFIFISIFYMFIANYIGQDVMDHTNQVFVTVYNVQWYVVPLHIQRIVLFLLQRGTKDFTLRVGGLFIGSLECFATLVKASVSYFTVMRSMR